MVDREVDWPVWVVLGRSWGLCVRSWAALGAYVGGLGATTTFSFQVGAATGAKNQISVSILTMNATGLGVGDGTDSVIDVETDAASANTGTGLIDVAIEKVNIQRSELGAVSNRLNQTVNNLTNISSNLSAAKGGIEDADFALETTNLAKNQILQQASTAMLAQANASQQNVLALLRS